jgi:hypothetical protein
MSEGVSVRAFAKQVGLSHVRIGQLVEAGRIPQNADGSIPLAEGLKAYEEMKSAPRNKGGRPRKDGKPPKGSPVKGETNRTPIEDVDAAQGARQVEAVNVNSAMNKARLAETTFKARLRELEYKLKSGELVEKTTVAAEGRWLAEQLKAKLMAIPPRISSLCEGRVAREIEEIITDALNGALKELQKCEYTKQ